MRLVDNRMSLGSAPVLLREQDVLKTLFVDLSVSSKAGNLRSLASEREQISNMPFI